MRLMLSDLEQALLRDVSFEAFRLYVQCLKPLMDIWTGLVGRYSEVSRAYIAIEMKFIPDQGSRRKPLAFTPKQIDALIDELIRKELVERVSTVSDRKKLVLRLPAAQLAASVRPQEEGDMSRHEEECRPHTPETPASVGFEGVRKDDERDNFSGHEADISRNHRITKTNHVSERGGSAPRDRARGSLLSPGFVPDASGAKIARLRGLDLQLESLKFVAYFQALAKPVLCRDWQARFRKWLLDARPYPADFDYQAGTRGMAPAARSAGGSKRKPWFLTSSGIEAKARELGYRPPADVPLGVWKEEVYRMAGITQELYQRAAEDFS